jgi:hypothetical protein
MADAEPAPTSSIIHSYVDCGINTKNLAQNGPLDNGRHAYHGSTSSLLLSELPIELRCDVFDYLDLQTLTNIRRVNQ